MNIKNLENKTILLLGKSRAFSSLEFDAQLVQHKINVTKEYNEDVALMIEGKMMTPYEQNMSDALYEEKGLMSVSIDELEKALAQEMDTDTLLMSLKLSHDKERLLAFIKNIMIQDELFFKLLKMYQWNGEDFFDNDENRDVTAALIGRFYENIERNHNVQYATLGLMHLVEQSKDETLIEVIASLEPLQKYFHHDENSANRAIVKSIAKHPKTSKNVLKSFIKKADTEIKILVALRDNCDALMQKQLFDLDEEILKEALSLNKNLDKDIAKALMSKSAHAKNIAQSIALDDELFERFLEDYAEELARNKSLMSAMQEKLFLLDDEAVHLVLASNSALSEQSFLSLFSLKNEKISTRLYANESIKEELLHQAYESPIYHLSLAKNAKTPSDILQQLAKSEEAEILEALAKNEKTPVEVLYQLQLDSRFERFVKENKSFGIHIQTQNIGWLV